MENFLLSTNVLTSASLCSRPRIINMKSELSLYFSQTFFCNNGSSALQGPHQVAKKLIRIILPFSLLMVIVFPSIVLQVKDGALDPTLIRVVESVCANVKPNEIRRTDSNSDILFILSDLGFRYCKSGM